MEAGYSTVDLAMLAIAAFVVWVAMRSKNTPTPKEGSQNKSQSTNNPTRSLTS